MLRKCNKCLTRGNTILTLPRRMNAALAKLTGIQLWSVIPDHFRSRAHVITYRISKNRSQNASSTAMESSASSLSYGFLTLAQGLS